MKRSHGNLSSSAIAKQFQCPFCDKSYSWKQTLKQHVSMYHRNKVHTDEFWRYELTKNRKTVLDDVANEDPRKQPLQQLCKRRRANRGALKQQHQLLTSKE